MAKDALAHLLAKHELLVMPCCFDALSARLIEMAGFRLTFMSGFAVSASRLAMPDTGLISYNEMLDEGRDICSAVSIPVIGDADTGYGNAMNIKRTVGGYASAGFASVMIEDQVAPKRCGHTRGKEVVPMNAALDRIRAAVDARDEGADVLILARTDAAYTHGISEAIDRACRFHELGADIAFVEAPRSEEDLARVGHEVPGFKMANMLEGGDTPLVKPSVLQEMGFHIAAYPLTLLSAAVKAMQSVLRRMAEGDHPSDALISFEALREIVGFDAYEREAARYREEEPG